MNTMLKFTKDHEWLRIEGDIATVGITQYAQEQLGDLVFVELPAPGSGLEPGRPRPSSNRSRPHRRFMPRSAAR